MVGSISTKGPTLVITYHKGLYIYNKCCNRCNKYYKLLQGQTECQIFLNKNIEIISNVAHLYPGIAVPVVSILYNV